VRLFVCFVVSESLRISPLVPGIMRVCTKDYCIPDTSIVIPKYSAVLIPVMSIQSDPENFPNPNTFDPERFMGDNKMKMHPYSYIVFGHGPRGCPGTAKSFWQKKTTKILLIVRIFKNYFPIPVKYLV